MLKSLCLCVVCFLPPLLKAQEASPLWVQGGSAVSLKIEPGKKIDIQGSVDKDERKNGIFLKLKDQAQAVVKTPPRPIHIILQSLNSLEIKNMKKSSVAVSLKTAQILLKNNQGDLKVHLDEGRLDIQSHKGSVEVHSYTAPVFLDNIQGSLKVSALRAPLSISKSQGRFNIQSFSGLVKLDKLSGRLVFHSEKSEIKLKSYKGSIQGYSGQGEVSGSLTPDQVAIETKFSPIRLYFANSKARIEAQSWEGRVLAPKNFYKDRAGGVYKASGSIRQRGDTPGYVQLKSRFGDISIL